MTPGTAVTAGADMTMMVLGVLLFMINDTLSKWLVGTYAVMGQLLLARSVADLLAVASSVCRAGRGTFRRIPRPGLQLWRIVFAAGESSLFF